MVVCENRRDRRQRVRRNLFPLWRKRDLFSSNQERVTRSGSSASPDTPPRGCRSPRQFVRLSTAPLFQALAGAAGETRADAGISEHLQVANRLAQCRWDKARAIAFRRATRESV